LLSKHESSELSSLRTSYFSEKTVSTLQKEEVPPASPSREALSPISSPKSPISYLLEKSSPHQELQWVLNKNATKPNPSVDFQLESPSSVIQSESSPKSPTDAIDSPRTSMIEKEDEKMDSNDHAPPMPTSPYPDLERASPSGRPSLVTSLLATTTANVPASPEINEEDLELMTEEEQRIFLRGPGGGEGHQEVHVSL
jgi:hypothetical protein